MREIPLSQGMVALVDACDFEYLNQWKWHYHREPKGSSGYAVRNVPLGQGKRATVRMHRLILNITDKTEIDHINWIGIDNRRTNLRIASRSQNCTNRKLFKNNTSGYKGVFWDTRYKTWAARIRINNKLKHLGVYLTKEEARDVYIEAVKVFHGEFAKIS